jgi:hypothetical protein
MILCSPRHNVSVRGYRCESRQCGPSSNKTLIATRFVSRNGTRELLALAFSCQKLGLTLVQIDILRAAHIPVGL